MRQLDASHLLRIDRFDAEVVAQLGKVARLHARQHGRQLLENADRSVNGRNRARSARRRAANGNDLIQSFHVRRREALQLCRACACASRAMRLSRNLRSRARGRRQATAVRISKTARNESASLARTHTHTTCRRHLFSRGLSFVRPCVARVCRRRRSVARSTEWRDRLSLSCMPFDRRVLCGARKLTTTFDGKSSVKIWRRSNNKKQKLIYRLFCFGKNKIYELWKVLNATSSNCAAMRRVRRACTSIRSSQTRAAADAPMTSDRVALSASCSNNDSVEVRTVKRIES